MFIFLKNKKEIINTNNLNTAKLIYQYQHLQEGAIVSSIDIDFFLTGSDKDRKLSISLLDPIKEISKGQTSEYLIEFGEYFLLTLIKYVGISNITISDTMICQIYTFFKYYKYNQQRIAELSGMNINDGIGKDVADCFIDREKDLQQLDQSDSTMIRNGLGQLVFNEKAIDEFFENERVFRQTFDIPIDPNDKEGIETFEKQREAVLSGEVKETDEEPPATE